MTGQNDRPDESLTGQAHDQAGHCPLTGRYFEPIMGAVICYWDDYLDVVGPTMDTIRYPLIKKIILYIRLAF